VREIKGRSGNRGAGGKSEERMGNQEEYLPNPGLIERGKQKRGKKGREAGTHGLMAAAGSPTMATPHVSACSRGQRRASPADGPVRLL